MSQELTECKNTLEKTANWDKTIDDCGVLVELYNETEDESLWEELQNTLEGLEKSLNEWEVQTTLSGEYDTYDAILTVNAGAGGTDAQDWAEAIMQMRKTNRIDAERRLDILNKKCFTAEKMAMLYEEFIYQKRRSYNFENVE